MNANRASLDRKSQAIAAGIAAGLVTAVSVLTLSHAPAEAKKMVMLEGDGPSAVVARIAGSASVNASKAREEMLGVYRRNDLKTGGDYFAAAKLFEASGSQEDTMMAHDFAIAGLALGDPEAKPIIARTEDRLFQAAGLGERYGTLGGTSLPLTDSHRELLIVSGKSLRRTVGLRTQSAASE